MLKATLAAISATLVASLSACSGGGGDSEESNPFCHTVPTKAITCSGCAQVSDAGAAFDGQFGTFASMGAGGQGGFRGTSNVQPAGSIAGVYFVLPNPAGITITITTFLDGIQQETSAPVSRQTPSDNCSGLSVECDFRDGAGSFVGIGTTKEYDAIEAAISNSSAGTVEVSELCVR